MNSLGFNKISNKDGCDRNMYRLNSTFNNHKYNRNQNQQNFQKKEMF